MIKGKHLTLGAKVINSYVSKKLFSMDLVIGSLSLLKSILFYLEKCIKVPKAALDIVVGWHLCKSHLQEDLSVLGPDLEPGELELEGKLALEQTFQHFTFFQC